MKTTSYTCRGTIALLVLMWAGSGVCGGSIIYVDSRAPIGADGSSWETAYIYLQNALESAKSGDEVRVAQGVYRPDRRVVIRDTRGGIVVDDVVTGDPSETFLLPRDVTVKGGYAGFGEPDPDARDIDAFRSVLSGDLLDNDVELEDLEWQSLLDFTMDAGLVDNCYTVVTATSSTEGTVLDGFFVTAGHAEGWYGLTRGRGDAGTIYFAIPQAAQDGAGAFISEGTPRFVRCTFYRNTTLATNQAVNGGAAVAVFRSDPTFQACHFEENIAFAHIGDCAGGAMLNSNSDPTLTDCTFENNVTAGLEGRYVGGAIANVGSDPSLTRCSFLTNRAIEGHGGAIYNAASPSKPTLTDCHFEGNSAEFGGAIHSTDSVSTVAIGCVFLQNQATGTGRGGAIDMGEGPPGTVRECYFLGNSAGEGGGAIACSGGILLGDSLFSGNSARNGGGLHIQTEGPPSARSGAGLSVETDGTSTVRNCTFAANHALNHGGAIYQTSGDRDIRNCIFWGDTPDALHFSGHRGSGPVWHNNIQGGYEGLGSADNIDADPKFRDPTGPDGIAGTPDDDLRLTVGSPCLDAGDSTVIGMPTWTDLDGNPRIAGPAVDMGAYEFHGPFSYYVDAAHGDDSHDGGSPREAFATIQKGIDTARAGYAVTVLPGVYQEEINFDGKAITVAGTNGGAVLEAPGGYAVSFYSAERSTSILRNFAIHGSDVGIFIAGSTPTIQNVTLADNEFGIAAYAGADPDISNCILWGNIDGDLFGCTATFSCIEQGIEGQGNIRRDPLFADPDNGDYHLLAERGRFVPAHKLWSFDATTSPCVDAGNPLLDPGAERMPNGGRINMGAFGGTPEASMSEWPLAADINRDGVVDYRDLDVVLEEWLAELPIAGGAADRTAPEPDPARWDIDGLPREVHDGGGEFDYYVEMKAAEAVDPTGPVEYFFECAQVDEFSSDWQTARDYRVLVGTSGQRLRFRVRARDRNHNMTIWSEWAETPATGLPRRRG